MENISYCQSTGYHSDMSHNNTIFSRLCLSSCIPPITFAIQSNTRSMPLLLNQLLDLIRNSGSCTRHVLMIDRLQVVILLVECSEHMEMWVYTVNANALSRPKSNTKYACLFFPFQLESRNPKLQIRLDRSTNAFKCHKNVAFLNGVKITLHYVTSRHVASRYITLHLHNL